jgi:hypothetical protein
VGGEGLHSVGDGLDDESGRQHANPDPVVRLQSLPKEWDGKEPAPDGNDGLAMMMMTNQMMGVHRSIWKNPGFLMKVIPM